jgi:hypothetical protein
VTSRLESRDLQLWRNAVCPPDASCSVEARARLIIGIVIVRFVNWMVCTIDPLEY